MDISINENSPALRVAGMRHVGPYKEMGPTFQKFAGWAAQNGLFGPTTRMLGIFHDDPRTTPEDQLRADACCTVCDDFQGNEEAGVNIHELGGGKEVIAIHVGPYEKLIESYMAVHEWLGANQITTQPGTSCYEIYIDDPTSTPPDKLRTEIHVPIN